MMARVSCSYTFADGDSVGACVEMGTGYPDALHEAVHTAAEMLREAMVSGVVMQQDDEGDDG